MKTEPEFSLEKLIEKFSFLFFGLLLVAGLADTISVYSRLWLVLTAVVGILTILFYRHLVETGPYDQVLIVPLKLWPIVFLVAVSVASMGGISSGYACILLFPVIISSLESGGPVGMKTGIGTYAVLLIFSLASAASRNNLFLHFPLIFIQLGLITFIAFWIDRFSAALIAEKAEKNRLVNLDREKSEFIGLASHHLRTPLSGIKGYIDYFQQGGTGQLNPDQKQIVARLDAGVRKIETVVENLLLAASMENGNVKVHRTTANFAIVLQAVLSQFDGIAKQKGIRYVSDIAHVGLENVSFDENRMREVLFNLLSNAFKYTDQGFVKVSAQLEQSIVHVQIEDSGIGIPPKEIPVLFQKFSRIGSVLEAFDQEGVGLGLYIARLIVESHGGRVWVESEVHKGSVFHFSFPK